KSDSPFIAGHDYLFCEYRLNCPKAPDKYITCRKFKNCDHIALANSLNHLELIKTNSTSPLNYFDNTLLNEHFANIVRKHPPCDVDFLKSIPLLYHSKVDCTFKWHQIDIVDVTKALHLTLQKSKGKSPDGLNLNWLRDHLPQISLFLTSLFNRSLESGIFPDAWKMVYIIPLNKVTPPKSPSDTRPIANLAHLSKVFERIVANQVVDYLEDNNLLDKYQSGFRKFHSTQSALLRLTEDIRCARDRGELTLLVLFDLSKAFDYRSQSILNDRNLPLKFLEISSGVPQGSVLGSILFLIVINLVARHITYCKYGLFADDKYIYH
ncbi:GSCOCG00012552001-RA-CDS, partial [Cotesia congregata]